MGCDNYLKGKDVVKKTILIDNKSYKEILITASNGELLASISPDDVIEKSGIRVELIPDFPETNQDCCLTNGLD